MPGKPFNMEQIISKLRAAEACRDLNVSEQAYYRWRKEYGGMRTHQSHRFKELEKENVGLKKLAADLALDHAILKETVRENL